MDGVGGFAVGAGLIAGPGAPVVAAVSRFGPVLVLWGLDGAVEEVAEGAFRLAGYGARWVGVQASAGREAMAAAAEALGPTPAEVVAVTLRPGLDDAAVASLGIGRSRGRAVSRLTSAAVECGARGILCALGDLGVVAQVAPESERFAAGVATAEEARSAMQRGASYVVVEWAAVGGSDPREALRRFWEAASQS